MAKDIYVKLPADNADGLRALGPFLAGNVYAVPEDVAGVLDARLERVTPKAGEAVEPVDAHQGEVHAHLRAANAKPDAAKPAAEKSNPAKTEA